MEEIIEILAMKIAKNVAEILQNGACDVDVKQMDDTSCESYKIEEVCKRLKVSKATLARHRKAGLLKASVYVGRSPRFTEEDINKYLQKFNVEGN
jgi:excisionase family DNA binding protein